MFWLVHPSLQRNSGIRFEAISVSLLLTFPEVFFFRCFSWCRGTFTALWQMAPPPPRLLHNALPSYQIRAQKTCADSHGCYGWVAYPAASSKQRSFIKDVSHPSHTKSMCQRSWPSAQLRNDPQESVSVQEWACDLICTSEIQGVHREVLGKSFCAPLGMYCFPLDDAVYGWAAEFLLYWGQNELTYRGQNCAKRREPWHLSWPRTSSPSSQRRSFLFLNQFWVGDTTTELKIPCL